jgi:hypothetical protein
VGVEKNREDVTDTVLFSDMYIKIFMTYIYGEKVSLSTPVTVR